MRKKLKQLGSWFMRNENLLLVMVILYLIGGIVMGNKKNLTLQDVTFTMNLYMWVTCFYIIIFVSKAKRAIIEEIQEGKDVNIEVTITRKDLEDTIANLTPKQTESKTDKS